MSAARARANSYVCLQCSSRLGARQQWTGVGSIPETSARRWEDRSKRTLKTSAVDRSKDETFAQREELTERRGPRFRKLMTDNMWQSAIKSKYLGRASEVLVLRDQEKKRYSVRKKSGSQPITPEIINPRELIDSINAQKNVSGQEEVNQTIDSMRPYTPRLSIAGTPLISQNELSRICTKLSNAFNQLQLARYISINEGTALLKEVDERGRGSGRIVGDGSTKVSVGLWRIDILQAPQMKKMQGKKELANAIVRKIWGFDVIEESEAVGDLVIRVFDEGDMALLLSPTVQGGLSTLSKTTRCRIQVLKESRVLQLTGPKYDCERLAVDIASSVERICDIDVDLRDIIGQATDLGDLQSFAESSRCSVTFRGKSKNQVNVRAYSPLDLQTFQRAVVKQALDSQIESSPVVTDVSLDNEGFMWQQELTLDQRPAARFMCASKLARGDVAPSLRYDENTLTEELMNKIWQQAFDDKASEESATRLGMLRDPSNSNSNAREASNSPAAQWNGSVRTSLVTEYGQIQYEDHAQHMAEAMTVGRAVSLAKMNRSSFNSQPPGVSQLFLSGGLQASSPVYDTIKITFIPSPWHSPRERTIQPPTMEMTLILNKKTRDMSIQSFTAILCEREVRVMMPHLATDLRVTRRDTIDMTSPELNANVAAYAKALSHTAIGYSRIGIAETLDLPFHDPAIGTPTFFSYALEYGHELQYKHHPGVNVCWQRVTVGYPHAGRQSLTVRTQTSDGAFAPGHRDAYRSSANEVLRTLNALLGLKRPLQDALLLPPERKTLHDGRGAGRFDLQGRTTRGEWSRFMASVQDTAEDQHVPEEEDEGDSLVLLSEQAPDHDSAQDTTGDNEHSHDSEARAHGQ